MTTGQVGQEQPGWVDEALREHAEHERLEMDAAGRRQLPLADREQQVLDRIDRARRRRPRVREERITMSHGAGGKATQTLIEAIFLDAFRNPLLEPLEDAAQLDINGTRVALTTDSYVVKPLFFPGGDIGDLAVNGTVNDLSVSGATPLYLSAGFILEEGFPVADLNRVVESMRDAAAAAGVRIVTGDTKVVEKGKADGCYINTAGVGLIERDVNLGVAQAQPGDVIIVSGPIGDHGITIMLARGELDIEADVESDTAPLNGLVAGLLDSVPGVRAMRDATRGGVATILNEIAKAADVGVLVSEDDIPVRAEVRGASRAARHRPHVRRLRRAPGRRGPARRGGSRGRRAARASARPGRGGHRPRAERAAGDRTAEDRVRRYQDRRPAGRRPAPPDLLAVF